MDVFLELGVSGSTLCIRKDGSESTYGLSGDCRSAIGHVEHVPWGRRTITFSFFFWRFEQLQNKLVVVVLGGGGWVSEWGADFDLALSATTCQQVGCLVETFKLPSAKTDSFIFSRRIVILLKSKHPFRIDTSVATWNYRYKKPENWKDEETMLQKLVAKAASMKPDLVFLAGDMQNWWPNEKGNDRRDMGGSDCKQLSSMTCKIFNIFSMFFFDIW